jgi:hypothetical protein
MIMEMNEAMFSLQMGRGLRGSETFRVISFGCCRLKLSGSGETRLQNRSALREI